MSTISRDVLKDCAFESTLKELQEFELLDYSHIKASDSFKERISGIIYQEKRAQGRLTPKRIIISIVAAVLVSLLIAFAASARLRQKTVDFFLEVHDKFSKLIVVGAEENTDSTDGGTQKEDPEEPLITYPTEIETVYIPSYIDENGYLQLDLFQNESNVYMLWINGEFMIDLSQNIVHDTNISMDTEYAEYKTAYIDNSEVFYNLKNGIYLVVWLDHGYIFTMTCDEELGWEEVEKIVLSLKPVDD